jgi:hypothetical protein
MQIIYWFGTKLGGFLPLHFRFKPIRASTFEPRCRRHRAWQKRSREHEWKAWEYQSPYSCEQRRICEGCASREFRIVHQWETWKADALVPGYTIVSCSRCDAAICLELVQLQRLLGPIPIP